MAVRIPRDAGSPFNPADPMELAEFQGFCSNVPSDAGMLIAVNSVPVPIDAHSVRAARLLRPGFLVGANALATPDPVTPNTRFERQGMRVMTVNVPNLPTPVDVWSFEANMNNNVPVDIRTWPAPTIRVREGQIVHTTTGTRTGPHTIHHHGIEPTAMNDGVGHLTFEIDNEYSYQWQAAEAGTYFYHCHRNTVLHFEMGMYGMLIVDPDVPGAPFVDGFAGQCHVGNTLESYAAEALWVADDFDIRWHGIDRDGDGTNITDHSAGLQPNEVDVNGYPVFVGINDPGNPHLHDFRPDVFLVTGRPAPFGADNALIATAPGTAITPSIARGQKLLIRTLNASYCTTRWKFPTELPGQVIAADARTFGREPFGRYSSPFTLASINHQFEFTTARRWDILLDIPAGVPTGSYFVEIEYYHWVTNERIRTVRTQIEVV
ncbi:MAG: multicopper oxidase domain-containing protein [Desulfuromonadales bacterium]|nr:multicopper oxidase domain-containing protein [Desulfuromonadales bacterium]